MVALMLSSNEVCWKGSKYLGTQKKTKFKNKKQKLNLLLFFLFKTLVRAAGQIIFIVLLTTQKLCNSKVKKKEKKCVLKPVLIVFI